MAFYLKYRPQTIKDLDLASVRDNLTKALESDSLPHSFLFAGPKGTGKTSAARILAKAVNCENKSKGSVEPCGTCEQCLSITKGTSIDVLELDAASHRGIDDIRTLRDAVKLSPAHAKRKVYIIDEAHMLTTEASNALLKTLEEPPEHVIFVLATTNPEKLIPTIRSRTTLIPFTKATISEIVSSLQKKLKGEGINAEEGALQKIAEAADGSFRDADKLLEQLVQKGEKLTEATVQSKLHASSDFDVSSFINTLISKDAPTSLKLLHDALDKGTSAESMLDVCIKTLRDSLLTTVGIGTSDIDIDKDSALELIHLLVRAKGEMKNSPLEQLPFELAIIEWTVDSKKSSDSGSNGNGNGKSTNGHAPILEEVTTTKEVQKTKVSIGDGESISQDVWARVLSEIRPINASTEALLRASRPLELSGNKLKLGVYYRFHKEHLESVNHRSVLEKVCTEIFGTDMMVECLLTEPPQVIQASVQSESPQAAAPTPADSPPQANNEKPGTAVLSQKEDEEIMQMAKDIFGE